MEDSMLAFHDVSTGEFADPFYGLDEDHEWREPCHTSWVDIEEMPASNVFSAEDELIQLIEDDTEQDDDLEIFPFNFRLNVEFPDDVEAEDSTVSEEDEEEDHEIEIGASFYGYNRTNVRRQNESELCARLFRKYRNKRKDCGKKRPANWQRCAGAHRQRRSVRFVSPQIAHRLTAHEYLDGFLN